jgi:alkylated DNA repair dioxygenase AlkB
VDGLRVFRSWGAPPPLYRAMQAHFTYQPGEHRATGWLFGDQPWPEALAESGPALIADLHELLGVRFEYAAFQAYLNGSGCDWHDDASFGAQAILSLGVTRTFGVRVKGHDPEWMQVGHGDLVYMPTDFSAEHEHCVPVEDIPGERISLVFRTRS